MTTQLTEHTHGIGIFFKWSVMCTHTITPFHVKRVTYNKIFVDLFSWEKDVIHCVHMTFSIFNSHGTHAQCGQPRHWKIRVLVVEFTRISWTQLNLMVKKWCLCGSQISRGYSSYSILGNLPQIFSKLQSNSPRL